MKKSCLFGLLLAVALSTSANAAEHRWGAMASYWSTADAADGFGPEVRFAFGVSDHVLLDFRGSYFSTLSDARNTRLEVMPLEAGLTLTTDNNDTYDFYAGLGGGYYDVSIKRNGYSYDADATGGFYASVGMEIVLAYDLIYLDATKATLVLEATYRMVETEGAPGMGDLSLSGPGAKIGFLLRW